MSKNIKKMFDELVGLMGEPGEAGELKRKELARRIVTPFVISSFIQLTLENRRKMETDQEKTSDFNSR